MMLMMMVAFFMLVIIVLTLFFSVSKEFGQLLHGDFQVLMGDVCVSNLRVSVSMDSSPDLLHTLVTVDADVWEIVRT